MAIYTTSNGPLIGAGAGGNFKSDSAAQKKKIKSE